ncbi:glycoside hydrolase family 43 protein [Cadophora sp. DSE1049]|nr:glycoside hydrolase family 43 protein [Cadophora sp. DSE1049]
MSSSTTYTNPIIPGFAPDPSIIFVDDTFYLTWTHIANGLHSTSQLSLLNANTDVFPISPTTPLYATQGLLAPTIRYHDAPITPSSFSEPIYFDFQGIDPSLFFDPSSSRAYIQDSHRAGPVHDPQCSIRQFEVEISSGKPLSPLRKLWRGIKGDDAEGPHVYFHSGWYYLLVAEGGTFEGHMITMARARNIWGPYEGCERNPVLTSKDMEEETVRHVGHGDLVQDGQGLWWGVCLGVRKQKGSYPLGRETFLMPVTWEDGGWPEFEQPRMTFEREGVVVKGTRDVEVSRWDGIVENNFIRGSDQEKYEFGGDGAVLVPSETSLDAKTGTTTFVGRRQRSLSCTVIVTLQIPKRDYGKWKAGLAVYKDNFRHAEIYVDRGLSKLCYSSVMGKDDTRAIIEGKRIEEGAEVQLRIEASSDSYTFKYKIGSELFESLGTLDTMGITALDFTGPLFGIFANGASADSSTKINFRGFTVR